LRCVALVGKVKHEVNRRRDSLLVEHYSFEHILYFGIFLLVSYKTRSYEVTPQKRRVKIVLAKTHSASSVTDWEYFLNLFPCFIQVKYSFSVLQ